MTQGNPSTQTAQIPAALPSVASRTSPPDGHGAVGHREHQFTEILPADHPPYDGKLLAALADMMKGGADTVKDGPDPEENLWVPAGYTYFGQFVDHDLTFDSTSSLNREDRAQSNGGRFPTNLRTPRFDLDCVYGDGPDAQPFMYADDGATLLLGGAGGTWNGMPTADHELLRSSNGLAIIGDKRNDENSIVNQIQQGFIKFHNGVVAVLKQQDPANWNAAGQLFESARNEVRWTYQKLVLEDFLPRIVWKQVLKDLADKTKADRVYALYPDKDGLRHNLPREFVVAAYRFGHSGVRTGYRLNETKRPSIFPGTMDDGSDESLIGFEPLAASHVIDKWGRFFPDTPPAPIETEDRSRAAKDFPIDPKVRLQFAYKIDPTIVDPLGALPLGIAGKGSRDQAEKAIGGTLPVHNRPSLALLNLLRGNFYGVRSGQAYVKKLQETYANIRPVAKEHLVVRTSPSDKKFCFTQIDKSLLDDTPLWFYVLAEAQVPVVRAITSKLAKPDDAFDETLLLVGDGARTQLGWVGGRIVAEVFYGLVDSDDDSFINKAPKGWKPIIGEPRVKNLLEFSPSRPVAVVA